MTDPIASTDGRDAPEQGAVRISDVALGGISNEVGQVVQNLIPGLVRAQVRRLTPVECERLMGWPDDHTRWRADGTEVPDSTRYRMCGNGVASPVAEWLATQLDRALKAHP